MKWTINPNEYRSLNRTVHYVIKKALLDRSQSEPQLVANLVWELPRAINNITFTGRWSIRAGGVFVHAQPFVKCNCFPETTPASVEIGDLLLLRTEVRGGLISGRKALLLQAKKIPNFPAAPDNENQHHLYATWPSFEYVRSTNHLNGKKRHITGPDLYDASRYLLIADTDGCLPYNPCPHRYYHYLFSHHCCTQTASPTHPELSHYRCFANELTGFLLGDAGKVFTSPPPTRTRNWDRVIEDLITVTASQRSIFMSRAGGLSTTERGQGQALSFLSGDQGATDGILRRVVEHSDPQSNQVDDGPPQVPEKWPGEDGEGGGISMIEFICATDAEAEGKYDKAD